MTGESKTGIPGCEGTVASASVCPTSGGTDSVHPSMSYSILHHPCHPRYPRLTSSLLIVGSHLQRSFIVARIPKLELGNQGKKEVTGEGRDSFGSTESRPTSQSSYPQNTASVIPFILFILSRNLVPENCLLANLALAADDVLISR